jgi:predicted RNA-binding protein YlqC (UPF0109 family)
MLKALLKFFTGGDAKTAAVSKAGAVQTDLAGFVEYVAKALVDAPDEVHVTREDREDGFALKIDCRREDIGKIVGKRGKTIMAIRSLVSGAAGRMHQRVSVEVVDVN